MKKMIFCFCFLFINSVFASIFYPEVKCKMNSQKASCFLKNETSKSMTCEFLVVAESNKGQLMSAVADGLIPPFEEQELKVKNPLTGDSFKFASGEASCRYL